MLIQQQCSSELEDDEDIASELQLFYVNPIHQAYLIRYVNLTQPC